MFPTVRPLFSRRLLWVAPMLALCACSPLSDWFRTTPKETDQASSVSQRQQAASDFLYHFSVAELFLENGSPLKSVSNNAAVINSYATPASTAAAKPVKLTIAVMQYRTGEEDNKLQALVPVVPSAPSFPLLSKFMTRMDKFEYTLHDISVVTIPVQPDKSFTLSKKDAQQALSSLREKRGSLLGHAGALSAEEEAKVQLSLLRFFIEQQKKDAAYLCADNVKRLLAQATQQQDDNKGLDKLSEAFAKLEGQLHTKMPY